MGLEGGSQELNFGIATYMYYCFSHRLDHHLDQGGLKNHADSGELKRDAVRGTIAHSIMR